MEKASWDPKSKKVFIDLVCDMVKVGNMRYGCLNKFGWKYVRDTFNFRLARNYSNKQFKNYWDYLKKDWNMFQSLRQLGSGDGWSYADGIITASQEWWMDKIKDNKCLTKFWGKGLDHYREMELIFGNTGTTSKIEWSPSSYELPTHLKEEEDMRASPLSEFREHNNYNVDATITDGGNADVHVAYIQNRVDESCSAGQGKRRKLSTGTFINKGVGHFAGTVINKSSEHFVEAYESPLTSDAGTAGLRSEMNKCLEILSRLPGIEIDSGEYITGARSMTDAGFRAVFLCLPNDECRASLIRNEKSRFLKDEINECLRILNRLPGIDIGGEDYIIVARSMTDDSFRALFLSLANDECRLSLVRNEKCRA